ncbi:DUF1127 domain-containing protein [Ensifer sp.]|uniref:DUF1127 domain-containing protein n=1 Tax=Ensifer sp. TaxID=1872086 RepID=UPI000DD6DB94|nr:DUF1127 domain-containing protein [Ensifer sp.]
MNNKGLVITMLRELALYLSASPRSRIWQLQQLRELDAERLVDIGVTPAEATAGIREQRVPAARLVVASVQQAQAARAGAL